MICNTVLDALGNTPMIRLNRMTGPEDAEILVKYEGLNIRGSVWRWSERSRATGS